jgi:DegV family protein with EDD domain
MYSSLQAKEAGFAVSPLSVTIGGESYREYDEISSDEFVAKILQGNMPTSSQPAVGDVAELYEQYPDDEILNISMAMGLSGTYNGAVAAAGLTENPERITVLNSRTLCGPHRFLVENAVELARKGLSREEIVAETEKLMDTAKSFLMPADFGYLRRGGRLSPVVSYVGQVASLSPVMTQTEDCQKLTVAGVRRGFASAIKFVAKALENRGVGAGWRIYITHAGALEKAEQAHKILVAEFPDAKFEIMPLSPAFITQGGPGCVAVQIIQG